MSTSNETINKLCEMRMSTMANAFRNQLEDPQTYKDIDFEERFATLVDVEYNNCKSNKVVRLIVGIDCHSKFIAVCVKRVCIIKVFWHF